MNQAERDAYSRILKTELVAAMGCTEPIAIAFGAAKAREVLGVMPEKMQVFCSGNIVKNVMGVTVPNSGGMKGIDVAATLGVIGGNAEKDLEVLNSVTEDDILAAKELLKTDFCTCALEKGVENLYIRIHIEKGSETATVEIRNYHKNITLIEKNGAVIYQQNDGCQEMPVHDNSDKMLLNVADILEYGNTLCEDEIISLLEYQLNCNRAIAENGLSNSFGAQVGKTLMKSAASWDKANARTIAKAYAAAGSDARMNGCAMPVVINSGSGNQGLTVSLPVWVYAKSYSISHERMIKALAVANLTAIHQKKYIGSLSAYCGAVSAACGAGAAIAYLLGENLSAEQMYQQVSDTVTDTIATIGGMVCDGAKSSCAAKIAVALDCAITAFELSCEKHVFQPGEGLVMKNVEETIESIGRMGREGMRTTDTEILEMMLERKI